MPQAVINSISEYANDVTISTEVKRYLLDIVVFLRMHRAVAGGVSPQATKDFELLVKFVYLTLSYRLVLTCRIPRCLAPLHNLDFATPALVSLAVFKVYSHRIALVRKAEEERSTLWGSSRRAVEEYLRLVDVETVVEEVLAGVKAPL
jgi:MoxR-like ATPase